jgi:hypothetical protein
VVARRFFSRTGLVAIVLTLVSVFSLAQMAEAGVRPQWISSFQGPADGSAWASDVAFSPNGAAVFVTGGSVLGSRPNRERAATTLSYDAATGDERWSSTEPVVGARVQVAHLVVMPDGSRLIVTIGAGAVIYTVAYDASTGARLWRSEYSGGDGAIGYPHAIATSPDGADVYVTGVVDDYYGTIAYDTATGEKEWSAEEQDGLAFDLGVSPDGDRVYVTGFREHRVASSTIAYDAATGAQVWKSMAASYDLAVGPNGSRLYLGNGPVALRTSDGSTVWERPQLDDRAPIVVGPNGRTLYRTTTTLQGAASVSAYRTEDGRVLWKRTVRGDALRAVGVEAASRRIFVLTEFPGISGDTHDTSFGAFSFRSRSGRLRWRQHFVAAPAAQALGPRNGRVVVTATGSSDQTGEPYVVTIADEA